MLDLAIRKARELPYTKGQQRHYALVLDKKNRVVSESANSYIKTHTVAYKASKKQGNELACYLHAEVGALIKDRHRRGRKLVVCRVYANGQPAPSEPCPVCKAVLADFPNIKEVIFS